MAPEYLVTVIIYPVLGATINISFVFFQLCVCVLQSLLNHSDDLDKYFNDIDVSYLHIEPVF